MNRAEFAGLREGDKLEYKRDNVYHEWELWTVKRAEDVRDDYVEGCDMDELVLLPPIEKILSVGPYCLLDIIEENLEDWRVSIKAKYKLLKDDTIEVDGRTLHRIQAVRDLACVREGSTGGYVEHTGNLSFHGDCWVSGEAMIYGDAKVMEDAFVSGNAKVYQKALVAGSSEVTGAAVVKGHAQLFGDTFVRGKATIQGTAQLAGHVVVGSSALIRANVALDGDIYVTANAIIEGSVDIKGDHYIGTDAHITEFKHLLSIRSIGSEDGILYTHRDLNGKMRVRRGCFIGTLEEFEEAVKAKKETIGYSKYYEEYMAIIELLKLREARY